MAETITGFSSAEVVRTLLGAIIQGDRAGSQRWTAELLCSERGYPKLLTVYIFLGFRYFLSSSNSWVSYTRTKIRLLEERWRTSGANLKAFRNSIEVRSLVAEWTEIWSQQQQKTPTKLPTKKEVFTAAASLKISLKKSPTPSLHPCVSVVWKAHYDSDDLRILSNEMMWALQYHQITRAVMYFSWLWELDDERQKTNAVHLLKRGPAHLSDSVREHIGWFIYALLEQYATNQRLQKDSIIEVLELWKESWLILGKQQRKQTLGAIIIWLTEGQYPTSQLIKMPDRLRLVVGDSEPIYGIIKQEMDVHAVKKQEEKEAAEKKAELSMDKFNMTPAQKEKAAMKKMEEANKHIAAALGIDFEEFDD